MYRGTARIVLKKNAAILAASVTLMALLSGCADGKVNNAPTPGIPTETPDLIAESPKATDERNDPTSTPTSTPTREPEVVSITISAAGDCTLGINYKMTYSYSFDEAYDKYGKSYFFKNVVDIFSKDDFSIVNLEGPLTTSKDRRVKLYNHIGRPEYVDILKVGSIEAVSFSNNHTYDFGPQGYEDTVRLLTEAGVAYASDGVYGMYETKGIKIGFVSVNEHYDGRLIEHWLEEGIKSLREQDADLVLACIHWGSAEFEGTSRIDDYQIELGQKCIDWGYDLVIGNHPHVLQGINKYKGRYITNCLGNFCYGGNKNPRDKDCGIFQQTFTFIDGELQIDDNVRFIPCLTSSTPSRNNYQPTVATGKEAKRIISKINALSAQFGVAFDDNGYVTQITLSEKDKANAYFAIFKKSLEKTPLERNIKHVGIDISALELSDPVYIKSLFDEWAGKAGVNLLVGTKSDLVNAGYHQYAKDGKGRVFIYEKPEWSNLQVSCYLNRVITLLNYLDEQYTAAYANGNWEVQKGAHIIK